MEVGVSNWSPGPSDHPREEHVREMPPKPCKAREMDSEAQALLAIRVLVVVFSRYVWHTSQRK